MRPLYKINADKMLYISDLLHVLRSIYEHCEILPQQSSTTVENACQRDLKRYL